MNTPLVPGGTVADKDGFAPAEDDTHK